jgi:cell division protein FtsL
VLSSQRVRARRDLRDLRFVYVAVMVSIAALAVVFAFLWGRLAFVDAGYAISKANTARSALLEKNKRLRVEFMRLKSPERIERIAQDELALVHPTAAQTVNLR